MAYDQNGNPYGEDFPLTPKSKDYKHFIPVKADENSTIKQPKRSGPPKTQVDHLVNSFRKLSFPQKQQFLSKIKIYL